MGTKLGTTEKMAMSELHEEAATVMKQREKVVGAKGFEPSTSWSRTRRASQAALRPDRHAPPKDVAKRREQA